MWPNKESLNNFHTDWIPIWKLQIDTKLEIRSEYKVCVCVERHYYNSLGTSLTFVEFLP